MATETDARHQMTEPGSMRIGLFIPCYIDLLFPEVGIATLELLERLGMADFWHSLKCIRCGA